MILGSSVADALYLKIIDNQLYLTLGFTYSNFNVGKFTAAFYLSKVTIWGAVWGDIPPESYERIGAFLEATERLELLQEEYTKNYVNDSWWDMNDIGAMEKFLKAVQITEDRFLAQPVQAEVRTFIASYVPFVLSRPELVFFWLSLVLGDK
ncbi:MAG: hypothetical protein J7577_11990 [Sphingobacteriaceae bacterium]|nr:hypothetical protein [Sphingobacteriaceae bacterium]